MYTVQLRLLAVMHVALPWAWPFTNRPLLGRKRCLALVVLQAAVVMTPVAGSPSRQLPGWPLNCSIPAFGPGWTGPPQSPKQTSSWSMGS